MGAPDSRPKVVAVIGSPRRHGNTATLVDAALEELERSGCECTTDRARGQAHRGLRRS